MEVPKNRPNRTLISIPSRLAWRIVQAFEYWKLGTKPGTYRPINPIEVSVNFRGHYKDFPRSEIGKIKTLNLDVIVRLGGRGIYRGPILDVAKGGLISIHHGDNRSFRGGPPGFWEVLFKSPQIGYIVQKLTDKLDGGVVLRRGEIATGPIASENRLRIYVEADIALADTMSEYLKTGELVPCEQQAEVLGPIYKMPGLSNLALYLFIRLRNRA